VEKPGLAKGRPKDHMQTFVAECSKAQLDALVGTMDAIEQGLEGATSST
jgi:hypothetical protein